MFLKQRLWVIYSDQVLPLPLHQNCSCKSYQWTLGLTINCTILNTNCFYSAACVMVDHTLIFDYNCLHLTSGKLKSSCSSFFTNCSFSVFGASSCFSQCLSLLFLSTYTYFVISSSLMTIQIISKLISLSWSLCWTQIHVSAEVPKLICPNFNSLSPDLFYLPPFPFQWMATQPPRFSNQKPLCKHCLFSFSPPD
jgi:hypothetical protein